MDVYRVDIGLVAGHSEIKLLGVQIYEIYMQIIGHRNKGLIVLGEFDPSDLFAMNIELRVLLGFDIDEENAAHTIAHRYEPAVTGQIYALKKGVCTFESLYDFLSFDVDETELSQFGAGHDSLMVLKSDLKIGHRLDLNIVSQNPFLYIVNANARV